MGGMESLPVVDREVTCKSFEVVMGASTVICACAYRSLGGEAAFVGLVGNDDYGDFMLRGLGEFGIHTELVERTSQVRTGVTVNLIFENTRTQVTYPGTIAEFEGPALDETTLRGFDHIHCGGVYLQTKFRPRITALLKLAKKLGITTSLDPQWDSSETWEYMHEWLPLLTYLFVNQDEALSIAKASSVEEAARWLLAHTHCPLIKIGKDGVAVTVDGALRTVPTRKVEVVDTTGAGDSFDAGFLYAALEKRMGLLDACQFANAVAARSCTFVGGTSARSTYDDTMQWLNDSMAQWLDSVSLGE